MEKRALLAIGLSFLVLLLWQWLLAPRRTPVPTEAPGRVVESTPAPAEETAATAATEPAPPPSEGPGAEAEPAVAAAEEQATVVETGPYRVELTNRGARIRSWGLKEFANGSGPLELIPAFAQRDDLLPLAVDLDDAATAEAINRALFTVETAREGDLETVRFHWADGRGLSVTKTLSFPQEGALVGIGLEVLDRGRRLPARLTVGPGLEAQDKKDDGKNRYHYRGQVVYDRSGMVTRTDRSKVDETVAMRDVKGLLWAGLEEQYFAALILPGAEESTVVLRPVEVLPAAAPGAAGGKQPDAEPQVAVAVSIPEQGAELFIGPKRYTLLRSLDHDLQKVVWFSSYVLIAWPAKWIFLALLWVHDRLIANYGLAIILTTLALRALLFPLNQHSMVNMRKMQQQMQRIQPKINAIKAKYKKQKDAQARGKMNEEMMALYRKEGVNPMGGMSGCLPLLIQFPILIAFYNVLTVAVELRGAPFFGWIGDLTAKDPYYITPLLMGATMFVQQKMSATKGGDPAQQRIMLMMPVVFTVMFLNLPSGLVLYWFVNNLLGIGQQWLVNRRIGRMEAAAQKA